MLFRSGRRAVNVSPSKIRESPAPSHLRVTAPMAASRGADCPAECCVYRRSGAFGLRRTHRCLAISGGPWWSSARYRPPSSVKKAGSSSRELGSPPEFVVPASARCHPGAFLGVSYLFATSAQRVHDRRASQAHLCSALSVSHALDGLLLARPCRLVSSCCHVQASRSRGFLPRPDRNHLVGGPCLRAVGAVPCRRLPDDAGERRVDLKALLQAGIRSTDGGVSPARCPCPLMRLCSFGLASPVLKAR